MTQNERTQKRKENLNEYEERKSWESKAVTTAATSNDIILLTTVKMKLHQVQR